MQFRLLRYFSVTSALVTVLMTVAVVLTYQSHQAATLLNTAEAQNVGLARSFANTIWSTHGRYLNSVGSLNGDELRARPETAEINQVMQLITKDLAVLKVKIFNLGGLTTYSSDFSQIGESKSNNLGFLKAVGTGTPASKTSYRGTFSSFSGVRANVHLAESYVPITDDAGKVTSVFELYTDVTPQIASMQKDTWSAAILAVIASGSFYLVLFLVVRRADMIIKRQYDELSSFNKQLAKANEKLDVALEHMSHGIAMFDAHDRLAVCNGKYSEIYGLSPRSVIPGMTQREILELRVTSACVAAENAQEYIEQRIEVAGAAQASDKVIALDNNRYVAVAHRPLPQGGWVSTHEDITHRKRTEAQIAHMAHHDALTGLANRNRFNFELERAIDHLEEGQSLAVLCLDLDRFKSVNDTLGHDAGDKLLKQVAVRIGDNVRRTDRVARLGGDEFVILQPGISGADDLNAQACRLVQALKEPFDIDGSTVEIGTSIGIAMAPLDAKHAVDLMKMADIALYKAKADGRSNHRFYEAGMDEELRQRLQAESDLKLAIAEQQFEMHYQPLYEIDRDVIIGLEALIRWRHPVRGMVSPAEFIPLAEETGLIKPIGAWTLKQACTDAMNWPASISVAVNISAAQFTDSNLVLDVVSALGSTGLSPTRLELEITESIILHDTELALGVLRQLKDLGCRISMDDFGTGYSSLSYLQKFPFDKIKIDRAFIDGINDKKDSLAIVRAVISLGRSLDMQTTGEGVETVEELRCLREEGCTQAQGYLISKPVPAKQISQLLNRSLKEPIAA